MSVKKTLRENFEYLSTLTVPEYTLLRKWQEINTKKWKQNELQRIFEIKNQIWTPKKPEDYLDLDPDLLYVETKDQSLTWTILRTFISTMPWNQNVGRIMRFIIYDRKTMSYLGVISIASDFISLSPRDSHIGWTYDHRIKKRRLNYTAMGSSIVPTQPLGFNFVGGKLITLMLCTDKVVNTWNEKYKKEPLTAITTTSLYGGFSQYNRLRHWKKCGTTEGKIPIEPTDNVYMQIREWVKEKYPADYKRMTVNKKKILSRPKSKLLSFAYTKMGIKPPENNAPRGVYLCKLYDNSNEFLSMKTDTLGGPLFDNDRKVLVDLWKERYASRRIKSILEKNRYDTSTLFYDNIIGKTWDETMEMYIDQVGK